MKKSELIEMLNKFGDNEDISADNLFKPQPEPAPLPKPTPTPTPIKADTPVTMTAAEFLQLINELKGSPEVEKPDNGGDDIDEIYF